jgi:hypothetical protein
MKSAEPLQWLLRREGMMACSPHPISAYFEPDTCRLKRYRKYPIENFRNWHFESDRKLSLNLLCVAVQLNRALCKFEVLTD